jgi:hypothetical protein
MTITWTNKILLKKTYRTKNLAAAVQTIYDIMLFIYYLLKMVLKMINLYKISHTPFILNQLCNYLFKKSILNRIY